LDLNRLMTTFREVGDAYKILRASVAQTSQAGC
jgi:hypothetical protein